MAQASPYLAAHPPSPVLQAVPTPSSPSWSYIWALLQPASHTHCIQVCHVYTHTTSIHTHNSHPSIHTHPHSTPPFPCAHVHTLPFTLIHVHTNRTFVPIFMHRSTLRILSTHLLPYTQHAPPLCTHTSTLLPPPQLSAGRIFADRLKDTVVGEPPFPPTPLPCRAQVLGPHLAFKNSKGRRVLPGGWAQLECHSWNPPHSSLPGLPTWLQLAAGVFLKCRCVGRGGGGRSRHQAHGTPWPGCWGLKHLASDSQILGHQRWAQAWLGLVERWAGPPERTTNIW